MIRRAVFAMLGAAAYAGAFADGALPLSDDAMKEKIVSFVTLPSRLCGRATLDFRDELKSRKITNRSWFDGDTNRLARLICELAQTNNTNVAEMMIERLGEYGTSAQLPFLYSCATNPVLGETAVESVLRIEGVTSNSVQAARNYFALTNIPPKMTQQRDDVCISLVDAAWGNGVPLAVRAFALETTYDFAANVNQCHKWLDDVIMRHDASYRYSRRRLAVLRSVYSRGINQYSYSYVTNAINELVAYPEANLPD